MSILHQRIRSLINKKRFQNVSLEDFRSISVLFAEYFTTQIKREEHERIGEKIRFIISYEIASECQRAENKLINNR